MRHRPQRLDRRQAKLESTCSVTLSWPSCRVSTPILLTSTTTVSSSDCKRPPVLCQSKSVDGCPEQADIASVPAPRRKVQKLTDDFCHKFRLDEAGACRDTAAVLLRILEGFARFIRAHAFRAACIVGPIFVGPSSSPPAQPVNAITAGLTSQARAIFVFLLKVVSGRG